MFAAHLRRRNKPLLTAGFRTFPRRNADVERQNVYKRILTSLPPSAMSATDGVSRNVVSIPTTLGMRLHSVRFVFIILARETAI